MNFLTALEFVYILVMMNFRLLSCMGKSVRWKFYIQLCNRGKADYLCSVLCSLVDVITTHYYSLDIVHWNQHQHGLSED